MKKLYQCLSALLCALCLGMHAMADILPEPAPEPPTKSPLLTILIIAVAVIAAAVLIIVLRHRKR